MNDIILQMQLEGENEEQKLKGKSPNHGGLSTSMKSNGGGLGGILGKDESQKQEDAAVKDNSCKSRVS